MNLPFSWWQRLTRASSPLAMTQTLTYYAAFIALGLTTASLGPTLLGLQAQTGSTLGEISFLFTARAFGYLIGSFIGGRLYDRLPGHRTMAFALFMVAAAMASVPMVPLLWLLVAAILFIGFMEAFVDVGGNTLIVWVHRERVAPYMNGLHLFFAIGAFLSPLLIAQAILFTGNFGWGYWLLALLLVPIALRLLPLPNPTPIVSRAEHAHVRPNYALLTLFVALFVCVSAAEASFAGWIFTYGVKTNLVTAEAASVLNSAFWGAFLLGRVISIPLGSRVRPRVIILADLLVSAAAIGLLILFPTTAWVLWLGTILFGLGVASAFPTMLSFAGRHMVITGAVTGWFFVGASIGGMTLPWVIGQLFESVSPEVVFWLIGATLAVGLGVFATILLYIKRREPA